MKIETVEKTYHYIGYGILLFGLLTLAVLPIGNKTNKIETTIRCRVDSVSVKRRYDVLPDLVTTYYTSCGRAVSSNQVYLIGDTIEFKIITVTK